jgi:hypothetical protein
VLTGNPGIGPYKIELIPGTTPVLNVEFDVDGSYWLTDTVAPFWLFRDAPEGLGTLGAGTHTIRADVRNASGVNFLYVYLSLFEGPPPAPPPLSPLFPADSIYHRAIDTLPLHPLNAQWIDVINGHAGHNLHPDFGTVYQGRNNGIPLNIVAGNTVPKVPVTLTLYASESDPIPPGGLPIPTNVLIEGDPGPFDPGADSHCLLVDTDTHLLHEFYSMQRNGDGTYTAKFHGQWDYRSNALRTAGWTSADAAGLPIAPFLVRYDEVLAAVASGGTLPHALRFTLDLTHGPYLWPARHDANSGGSLNPPFGMRVRLKAAYDISAYSPTNQAILRTLKRYGMFLADNGGDWFVQGMADLRWNDGDLHLLGQVLPLHAFEVVDASGLMIDADSGQAR